MPELKKKQTLEVNFDVLFAYFLVSLCFNNQMQERDEFK